MIRPPVRRSARLHRQLGAFFAWWGWQAAARQALGDAVRAQPDWAAAHVALAESLGRSGRWRESARSLRRAVALAPHDPEVHGHLVLALGRAGEWSSAVAAIDALIRVRPHDAEPHLLRGALLRRAGRPSEAIRAFRWAVRLPPGPGWNRFFLGELLLGPGDWRRMLSAYAAARGLDPGRALRTGSALNGHPGDPLLGRLPGAGRLERRPRLAPGLAARAGRAGVAAGRRARRRAAGVQAHLGLLVFGRRPDWMLRVLRSDTVPLRSGAGLASLALAAWVLVLSPAVRAESPAAREAARECASATGPAAVGACQTALDLGLEPERATVTLRLLATELGALERWDEMVEAYRALVRLRPEDADARYRLGVALFEVQAQPEAALRELDRAARLDPSATRVHAARGAALNALGRHEDALAAFATVESLDAEYLARHPASQRVRDASRAGLVWP